MPKKLTVGNRGLLFDLVDRKITRVEPESTARDEAATAFASAFRAYLVSMYPQSDMKILAAYSRAQVHEDVLRLFSGELWWGSGPRALRPGIPIERNNQKAVISGPQMELVLVPMGTYVKLSQLSEGLHALLQSWWSAWVAAHTAVQERRQLYYDLIQGSRTFEELVSIWPEARELESAILRPLKVELSVVTPALRSAIVKDTEERGVV
jgi:hypothetical protein